MMLSQNVFQNWGDALTLSLQQVWTGVIAFVPTLIIAVLIFAIGWILAMLLERMVEALFRSLRVDAALRSAGMEDVVRRAGHNLNSGMFVGSLVKWFVIVVFLMASFDILGLTAVNDFLGRVVEFLPSVIVAVLILIVAAIVGNVMQKIVVASSRAGHVNGAEFLGRVTKWTIWLFAIFTALYTLGIAAQLIQMVLTAVFAGVALAIGLSFGLGGKDFAQKIIDQTTHNMFD